MKSEVNPVYRREVPDMESHTSVFPTSGGSVAAAREYCERCPVKTECADYAIEHRVHHGVWGGLSERDRRRARVAKAARGSAPDRKAS